MKKKVTLCGKACTLENNALLPRRYRNQFGRDLIVDMKTMVDAYQKDRANFNTEVLEMDAYQKDRANFNTEVLENISWLMLKEAGEQVGENPEEWLASLDDTFAVYEIIGDVVELWGKGRETTSKPKKK